MLDVNQLATYVLSRFLNNNLDRLLTPIGIIQQDL